MTNFTFSSRRMSSSGSPETAMMSAYFPGCSEPRSSRLAEQIGGVGGGGLDGLHRRHAVLHHERKLPRVDAVRADAASVPNDIFTPARSAFVKLRR